MGVVDAATNAPLGSSTYSAQLAAALGLLAFVSGWTEFLLPFVFMPSGSQATLSLLVRALLGEGRFVDYGLLTAVGLYYVLPILILFLFAQDHLMKVYGGGVKG